MGRVNDWHNEEIIAEEVQLSRPPAQRLALLQASVEEGAKGVHRRVLGRVLGGPFRDEVKVELHHLKEREREIQG